MKKILLLLFFGIMLIPMLGRAQSPEEAGDPTASWSYPAIYNVDEKVSWFFDLEGTKFVQGQDLYLWAWSPSEPDAGNWANSSDFAKLIYVKDMIWRMELTPTAYFKKTVAEIKGSTGFWMRIKDKTGLKQSGVVNMPMPTVNDFVESGKMYASVPEKFTVKTPMAILFNANLADNKDAFLNAPSVHLHAGLNNWAVLMEYHAGDEARSAKTKMVNMGNGIYRKDIIPSEYFGVEEDFPLENITFLAVVKDWQGTSPDGVLFAANVPIPPSPVFSIFPLKVSKNDILTLTRENNVRNQSLYYTITGGGKTLTGEIPGPANRKRISFNLGKEFKEDNISKLHVTVKDQNNTSIYDNEVLLIKVDNPTK